MSASVVGLCGGLHVGGSVQRIAPVAAAAEPGGGGLALVRAALVVGDDVCEDEGEAPCVWGDLARLKEAIGVWLGGQREVGSSGCSCGRMAWMRDRLKAPVAFAPSEASLRLNRPVHGSRASRGHVPLCQSDSGLLPSVMKWPQSET